MLTINNPGTDRDDLARAHPGRPHAARICTRSGAAASQLAASESKCVPPVFTLPSVLLLGDAAFHLHHLGPSFVLVCIFIVLDVLRGHNGSAQLNECLRSANSQWLNRLSLGSVTQVNNAVTETTAQEIKGPLWAGSYVANLTKIKNACKEKSTNVFKGLFVEKFTF